MNLVVVESPTKARTLSRFLEKDYKVESTMGHVRDLPKTKFGVDLEHDFAPEYVIIVKKKEAIAKIKKQAKDANKILLATDPDREGEAIAYHVFDVLSKNQKSKIKNQKFGRIVFHEITESAVRQALSKPRDIDMNLVSAQTARRVLDRIVGYKLSPLLWKKVRRGLSAGRVQSVAVRLIVEREREIENFKPEEYWEIWVEVAPLSTGPVASSSRPMSSFDAAGTRRDSLRSRHPSAFLVKLIKINGQKAKISNKERADEVVTDLEKSTYKISSVEKKEVLKSPVPPYTTSTMTQAAARSFFWSAKRTMSVAQRLYEEGLITYHRTDSTNLAQEAINSARAFISKEYGDNYLPEKPRIYKTKSRVAQEAHEAIRPTDVGKEPGAKDTTILGRDADMLYGLIWRRFVASQMKDSVYDQTVINISANGYLLQAKGIVLKFDGWKKIYQDFKKTEEEIPLPEVREGEKLQLIEVSSKQEFTQPLQRYTEATLIKTLEKLGIGRPSTYAPIISTIQGRQYVEKKEGKFLPTNLGVAVNDFLIGYFPDVFDYKFTARLEEELDDIANGRQKWVPTVREFWQPFSEKLEGVEEKAQKIKVPVEATGEVCPKCKKGYQVIKFGKFGKFLSCSRFPDCDWAAQYIEKTGMKCLGCGEGEVIIRKTRKGKSFYGCSRYPKCNWASWRKPKSAS